MGHLSEHSELNDDFQEIQSDSDSSEGEVWAHGVNSPFDERGRELIIKRKNSTYCKEETGRRTFHEKKAE